MSCHSPGNTQYMGHFEDDLLIKGFVSHMLLSLIFSYLRINSTASTLFGRFLDALSQHPGLIAVKTAVFNKSASRIKPYLSKIELSIWTKPLDM